MRCIRYEIVCSWGYNAMNRINNVRALSSINKLIITSSDNYISGRKGDTYKVCISGRPRPIR